MLNASVDTVNDEMLKQSKVRVNTQKARQKVYYDQKRDYCTLNVGQTVMFQNKSVHSSKK